MESNTDNIKSKLALLESLSETETEEALAFKRKLEVLKEVALSLLEEVEALEHVRSINIRRGINLYEEMRTFEINLIQTALERTGGHQTRAAQLLGVNLTTLHNKLKRLNISPHVLVAAPIVYEETSPREATDSFYEADPFDESESREHSERSPARALSIT